MAREDIIPVAPSATGFGATLARMVNGAPRAARSVGVVMGMLILAGETVKGFCDRLETFLATERARIAALLSKPGESGSPE